MTKMELMEMGLKERQAEKLLEWSNAERAVEHQNAQQWKSRCEKAEGELAKSRMEWQMDLALLEAGARSSRAARALVENGRIAWKDGKLEGLAEEILRIKREAPYLFREGENPPPPMKGRTVKAGESKEKWRKEAGLM